MVRFTKYGLSGFTGMYLGSYFLFVLFFQNDAMFFWAKANYLLTTDVISDKPATAGSISKTVFFGFFFLHLCQYKPSS